MDAYIACGLLMIAAIGLWFGFKWLTDQMPKVGEKFAAPNADGTYTIYKNMPAGFLALPVSIHTCEESEVENCLANLERKVIRA